MRQEEYFPSNNDESFDAYSEKNYANSFSEID